MSNIWQKMVDILKAPLTNELDTIHLFLLTGLVLVMIAAWLMIMHAVRETALEVV